MVELQIVVLAVAGSSPVDRPISLSSYAQMEVALQGIHRFAIYRGL
jgi:hypothetical protein